jgi:multidrug efflux pump subunit AcrA (membrane-fusion protein)
MAPHLREDLVAVTVDEQGVACIQVTDPITAIGFRFYDFEYALAQQLTGQSLEAVIAWADETYGLELTRDALDQFVEKLAGLGFLVGGSAGAQPAVLSPLPSSGSAAFEGLSTTVAGGASPLLDSDPTGPFEDPTPSSAHAGPPDVLPRLKVLSGPLPPVSEVGAEAPPKPTKGRESGRIKSQSDVSSSVDTPLGAITHAIVAETSAPPPIGALDAPVPAASVASAVSTSAGVSEVRDSWAAALVEQVDKSRGERRQPPRPEVVIMPPVAEPSAAVHVPRRRSSVWLVLLVLGGAAGGAAWFLRPAAGPNVPPQSSSMPAVHVVTPQPTTFYRWFESVGVVVPGRNDTLGFSNAGRVQDVMPPGTTFSAGETVGRLQGVVAREIAVNRLRARVANSSLAEGNQAAAHLAEAKLAARKQELAQAQSALAAWEIHPKVAGEIAEVLIHKGDFVKPDVPVLRVRATGPRAVFSMPVGDVTRARGLPFCRVETIPGSGGADGGAAESKARAIDCSLSTVTAADEARFGLDLVGATSVLPGTQVRLASARYDGVFPVPASALASKGGVHHVWVASGAGQRAENRVVEVAATVGGLVLVARGVGVGEAIVVDPPAGLKTGEELSIVR